MKWFLMAMKNYAGFTGRARRKEFWWFIVFYFLFSIVTHILDHMLGLNFSPQITSSGWIGTLYSLVVLIPSLAVTVRRFHDIGKSGWVYARFCIAGFLGICVFMGYFMVTLMKNADMEDLQEGIIDPSVFTGTFFMMVGLFMLFLLVLVVWQLIYLFRDSQYGDNKWGPNPKGERVVVDAGVNTEQL